jgi:hypothetical protein
MCKKRNLVRLVHFSDCCCCCCCNPNSGDDLHLQAAQRAQAEARVAATAATATATTAATSSGTTPVCASCHTQLSGQYFQLGAQHYCSDCTEMIQKALSMLN